MANNLDRPERRIQNGSLSLNMRPFSFNFSAQCRGRPQRIYWDFLFLVGFLIEDSKTLGGKREMFALKTSVSSAELVERQGGNLLEQVIFLEGCLTAVSVLD